jgi:hypothetical protein
MVGTSPTMTVERAQKLIGISLEGASVENFTLLIRMAGESSGTRV